MYNPIPIDTSDVILSDELLALTEMLAENTHNVWAQGRLAQGWTYGPVRNDDRKETPCLLPYAELSESEKEFDRRTSCEAIKLICKMGYTITKK